MNSVLVPHYIIVPYYIMTWNQSHHFNDFDYDYRWTVQNYFTECCGREVSTPALYSGLRLKSQPTVWLSWLRVFMVFLNHSKIHWNSTFKQAMTTSFNTLSNTSFQFP
jgi:hypothetical protein